MQLSQIPAKFSTVWASSPDAGTIRTVPVTPSGTPGAASFQKGFPAITFVTTGAGGIPPSGLDENGILNIITAWAQWAQAGGAQPFDATFAAEIGGYPKSALLPALNQAGVWYNDLDNNSADPDTGGGNWTLIGPGMAVGGDLSGTVGNAQVTVAAVTRLGLAQVAPNWSNAEGLSIGSSFNQTWTQSITAPAGGNGGWVMAEAKANLTVNNPSAWTLQTTLKINGASSGSGISTDTTNDSQSHLSMLAIAAGQTFAITYNANTFSGTPTSVTGTFQVRSWFLPNPI